MKIPRFIRVFSCHALLVTLPMLIPFSVVADETEIFFQNDGISANANVLFLLDGSGSMREGIGADTRMQVMKNAFREVMEDAPDDINIGLMDYANSPTGTGYGWSSIKGVAFPVSPADQDASEVIGDFTDTDNISVGTSSGGEELKVKEFLASIVDTWWPSGYTPIVDSLYEAARYFRGEEVVWGKFPPAYKWAAHPSSYTGSMQCDGSATETCTSSWGQCNGTEQNCSETVLNNVCCNWLINAEGDEYCENGLYSCTDTVTDCEHTVCDSISGDVEYNTPIEHACQSNYLVLMSDGKPEYSYYPAHTSDGAGRYAKSAYPDQSHDYSQMPQLFPDVGSDVISTSIPDLIGGICTDSPNGYASGTCGPELTDFLANSDLNSELEGDQTVETYTVAFGLGDEPAGAAYLASLATAEDGAFTADNASELVAAFQSVFGEIEKNSFSFSSPSFSVSEDSLLSHGADVYVPVMDVSRTAVWSGNLRKFTLADSGSIVSVDGSTAALTSAGEFTDEARDLWSAEAHGANVTEGGAANKLPAPDSRVLYTDPVSKGLSGILTTADNVDELNALFSKGVSYRTDHQLHDWLGGEADGNSLLGWYIDCDGVKQKVRPFAMPGFIQGPVNIEEVTTCAGEPVSDEERDTLINFVRGYVAGETGDGAVVRNHIGDMLNTKPVVVTYGTGDSKVSSVFIATNEGYLHSIDAATGVENWAFMPSSLLKNQQTFLSNETTHDHVYGLDGPMTLWQFKDADEVEKKYLFFSMRRGGNMIYALDISTSTPTIAWKISPTGDAGAISTGFSELGETWSKPTLSRMRNPSDPSELLHVLVFGGGYDSRKDEQDAAARVTGEDELGSDVYIVNALNGQLLWSLKGNSVSGSASLTDSVPGDIRVLDMDNDGALDRMYFADTGGHVWRVDIATSVSGTGDSLSLGFDATLTEFADLGAGTAGGTSGDGDRRKFFYEPDTALRLSNGVPTLTVSIGSGYRTHPLDEGDGDRFYVLLDRHVYETPPSDFDTITEGDLMSVTELRGSSSGNILNEAGERGWYYPLEHSGEKVLASSLTFLDKVLFTTFAMADESGVASAAETCEPAVNTSRAYVLDLLTGNPVANLDRVVETDDDGDDTTNPPPTNEDFIVAGFNELLDSPQLIFSELTDGSGGDCTLGNCHQSVSVRIGKLNIPLLDLQNSAGDANGSTYSSSVDLTRILPRLYWRDDDVTHSEKLEGVDSSSPSPD
uniref:Type IV fimbrial biogenesis protein PilY1 n=1 Tax=uncultured Thiotrichaceae bacterium TaxID=298394 RepID=A0A6S6UJZ3_9GAMM|nr:MAG: Type IV fimbrial biogenesis protein PilY1 [uncultured Thiotrichaceae bacterium]